MHQPLKRTIQAWLVSSEIYSAVFRSFVELLTLSDDYLFQKMWQQPSTILSFPFKRDQRHRESGCSNFNLKVCEICEFMIVNIMELTNIRIVDEQSGSNVCNRMTPPTHMANSAQSSVNILPAISVCCKHFKYALPHSLNDLESTSHYGLTSLGAPMPILSQSCWCNANTVVP